MHIPDGFVSPAINMAGFTASAAVCALAAYRAEKTIGERQVPLMGTAAAFIFAAQMLNFPVAAGTSGHFVGAFLAAILLGPLNACMIMAVVLAIQCLLFADGGLTALGVNIFNMGIVAAIGGYAVFWAAGKLLPKTRAGFLTAVSIAAWASVVMSSAACALELAASATSPLYATLGAMAGIHAVIGIGEALVTSTVVSVVLAARPDLVDSRPNRSALGEA